MVITTTTMRATSFNYCLAMMLLSTYFILYNLLTLCLRVAAHFIRALTSSTLTSPSLTLTSTSIPPFSFPHTSCLTPLYLSQQRPSLSPFPSPATPHKPLLPFSSNSQPSPSSTHLFDLPFPSSPFDYPLLSHSSISFPTFSLPYSYVFTFRSSVSSFLPSPF